MTWRSKVRSTGTAKAHFVHADGTTACADTFGPWGIPMRELLQCAWTDLNPDDHKCAYCRKKEPAECTCFVCRVKAASKGSIEVLI